ncbi:MAG: eukaryotic translation initiation factor 4E, partial [Watsoniomyces obsoletus]
RKPRTFLLPLLSHTENRRCPRTRTRTRLQRDVILVLGFMRCSRRRFWTSRDSPHFALATWTDTSSRSKTVYHLFKKGVRPEGEDLQNKHGGKWSYQFKDKKQVNIDELWLHTQLAAIGETLEDESDNELMGVVVNVRKGFYRVGLWTRTTGKAGSKDTLMKLGNRFKSVLQLPEQDLIEFSGHTDAARAGSTRANAKYTV